MIAHFRWWALGLLLLLAAACGGNSGAAPSNPITPHPSATATSLPPEDGFDALRAIAHVRHLTNEIGPRPAGTAAEAEAAAYLRAALQSYGYQVEDQTFQYASASDEGTSVEIIEPVTSSLEANPISGSALGEITGELVPAGKGHPNEFPIRAAGNIVLIQRGEISFSEKAANAAQAGVAGVIIYNDEPGKLAGTLQSPSSVPVVGISQESGAQLLRLQNEQPLQVRVQAKVEEIIRTSRNVFARPPFGFCEVVAGAHYDSVPQGPGANDNASGTATIVEMARAMAADGQFGNLCFVLFGAEEVGLLGSQAFIQQIPTPERHGIAAMVNLDMVGAGTEWLADGTAVLQALAAATATAKGLNFAQVDIPAGLSSDHISFLSAGAPAVLLSSRPDPRYHTAQDTSTFIQPNLLAQAAALAAVIIESYLTP